MSKFEEFLRVPTGAEELIALSDQLATGEYWLNPSASQESGRATKSKVAPPKGQWGRLVDALEQDFAESYDNEEYENQALKVLNLQEFDLLSSVFAVGRPWNGALNTNMRGCKLVDVGCGTGRVALYGAALGAEVMAFDQTDAYVDITARKMSRLLNLVAPIELETMPAETYIERESVQPDFITAMFGVLNHCEDWPNVLEGLSDKLVRFGSLALSMYGSPEAVVFRELENGLEYEPAIMVRRAEGGLLLGADSSDILPSNFPYPQEVAEMARRSGLTTVELRLMLMVPSLFPKLPTTENNRQFVELAKKNFGRGAADYLSPYVDDPAKLLVASLVVDEKLRRSTPVNQLVDLGAYFGLRATDNQFNLGMRGH